MLMSGNFMKMGLKFRPFFFIFTKISLYFTLRGDYLNFPLINIFDFLGFSLIFSVVYFLFKLKIVKFTQISPYFTSKGDYSNLALISIFVFLCFSLIFSVIYFFKLKIVKITKIE